MASPGPPTEPPLMALLDRATRLLQDGFVASMAAAGHPHSLAASRIMGSITSDGVRLSDLADRLGITKQSVGQIVDDLESAGYVERRPDPVDGRAKLIVFGPRGNESLPAAWAALRESDERVARALGESGASALRGSLQRLLEELDAGGPAG